MKRPPPAIHALARQLLEGETRAGADAEAVAAGAEAVLRKAAADLEPLLGPTGFHVLLARALHLARSQYPLLEGVKSEGAPDVRLDGLKERVSGRDPGEVEDAVSAVLASFLGVLAYFIGEELTVRIVSRAWPELPSGAAGSAFEEGAV